MNNKENFLVLEKAKLTCNKGAAYGFFVPLKEEEIRNKINNINCISEKDIKTSGFVYCTLSEKTCN